MHHLIFIVDILNSSFKKNQTIKTKKRRKLAAHAHKNFGVPDAVLMLLGALTAGFALKGFLIPNNFIDGGATGITLLIHELFHYEFSIVIVVVNIPFMIFGMYVLGRKFILRTLIAIVCLGLFTSFIPYPVVTSDKVLTAIFGGFLAGLGIGLT